MNYVSPPAATPSQTAPTQVYYNARHEAFSSSVHCYLIQLRTYRKRSEGNGFCKRAIQLAIKGAMRFLEHRARRDLNDLADNLKAKRGLLR